MHWVPSRGRSESAALGVCESLYTHTLRVLPIHFGRETVPSGPNIETELDDCPVFALTAIRMH